MYSKTIAVGRLTKDPEVKHLTINGEQRTVCNFSIASDDSQAKDTDFYNVVVWGRRAEACGNNLHKGRLVLVEGRHKTRTNTKDDGSKQYFSEIRADEVKFLDSKNSGEGQNQGQQGGYQQRPQQPTYQQPAQQGGYQQQQPQYQQPQGNPFPPQGQQQQQPSPWGNDSEFPF